MIKWRTVLKTAIYKLGSLVITIVIVFLFTRKLSVSLGVGGIELIATAIWYYLFERWWKRLKRRWKNRESYNFIKQTNKDFFESINRIEKGEKQ